MANNEEGTNFKPCHYDISMDTGGQNGLIMISILELSLENHAILP